LWYDLLIESIEMKKKVCVCEDETKLKIEITKLPRSKINMEDRIRADLLF